jgi:hypothetical protein
VCVVQVLQLWVAPYRHDSHNSLATLADAALVVQFTASLGVQINAKTGVEHVSHVLLVVSLFVSAFAVFFLIVVHALASRTVRSLRVERSDGVS